MQESKPLTSIFDKAILDEPTKLWEIISKDELLKFKNIQALSSIKFYKKGKKN